MAGFSRRGGKKRREEYKRGMPRRFLKDHGPNVPEGTGALPAGSSCEGASYSDGTARGGNSSNNELEETSARHYVAQAAMGDIINIQKKHHHPFFFATD